jgi:hypothetical protein
MYTGSEALIKRRQQKVCELVAFFWSGGEVECPDLTGEEERRSPRGELGLWCKSRFAGEKNDLEDCSN